MQPNCSPPGNAGGRTENKGNERGNETLGSPTMQGVTGGPDLPRAGGMRVANPGQPAGSALGSNPISGQALGNLDVMFARPLEVSRMETATGEGMPSFPNSQIPGSNMPAIDGQDILKSKLAAKTAHYLSNETESRGGPESPRSSRTETAIQLSNQQFRELLRDLRELRTDTQASITLPATPTMRPPPQFRGERVMEWLQQMEIYHEGLGLDERRRLLDAASNLGGDALTYYLTERRKLGPPTTWNQFCAWLVRRFATVSAASTLERLRKLEWKGSLDEFSTEFARIVDGCGELSEAELARIYVQSIPLELWQWTQCLSYDTWHEARDRLRSKLAPWEHGVIQWWSGAKPALKERALRYSYLLPSSLARSNESRVPAKIQSRVSTGDPNKPIKAGPPGRKPVAKEPKPVGTKGSNSNAIHVEESATHIKVAPARASQSKLIRRNA